MPDQITIAQLPVGLPITLAAHLGNVLDAALGGAMLAPGDGPTVSARIVLRDDQDTQDAVVRLSLAESVLRGTDWERPDVDDADRELTVGRIREDPAGGLSVGINGSTADDAGRNLLAITLPALDSMGAPNYLEWKFDAPMWVDGEFVGPPRTVAIIATRPAGKTPHELRQAAETCAEEAAATAQTLAFENGALRDELDQLRTAIDKLADDLERAAATVPEQDENVGQDTEEAHDTWWALGLTETAARIRAALGVGRG